MVVGGVVGSYPLLSLTPTPVEVELGCDNFEGFAKSATRAFGNRVNKLHYHNPGQIKDQCTFGRSWEEQIQPHRISKIKFNYMNSIGWAFEIDIFSFYNFSWYDPEDDLKKYFQSSDLEFNFHGFPIKIHLQKWIFELDFLNALTFMSPFVYWRMTG